MKNLKYIKIKIVKSEVKRKEEGKVYIEREGERRNMRDSLTDN